MKRALFCTVAASLIAAPLAAQPVTTLRGPDFEYPVELSNIVGLHELADGRVVILDRKEKKVLVLEPGGQATAVGREGSGPGEYLRPTALIPMRGDTTLIEDGANKRFLVLSNGRVSGTTPPIQIRPQEGVTYTVTPRGADAQGRLYILTPTGLARDERIPILRLDRASGKLDTVASIRNDRFGIQRGRPAVSSGGASFGMTAQRPWAIKDEWIVMSDGSIAVVHNDPYALDWIAPNGSVTSGRGIAFAPTRVTEAERERWREQQRESGGGTLTTTDASGNRTVQKIPVPEPDVWPQTLPAFSGSNSVLASPGGTIWVQRLGPASAKRTQYDIVDRRGVVIERVELPLLHRVIGFGRNAIYVIRQDDDGLQHLQRYTRR